MAPDGAVIHDGWIEHDPANAEPALAELHASAARNPASALRRAVERQPGNASAEAIARWLAARKAGRARRPSLEPTREPGNASSGTA